MLICTEHTIEINLSEWHKYTLQKICFSKKILEITDENFCELDGNLILSEYQRKGIMVDLVKMQIDFIRQLGYTCTIAKTHPKNIAGNKLF